MSERPVLTLAIPRETERDVPVSVTALVGFMPAVVLVLAAAEPDERLVAELQRRDLDAGAEVLVVAPVLAPHLGFWTDEERWHRRAQAIANRTVARLAAAGFVSRGVVGDAHPLEALEDALRRDPISEVIVVGSPFDCTSWLDHDLVRLARARHEIPITVLAAASDEPCPWHETSRRSRRVAAVALVGLVIAAGLALAGAGQAWLVGELGIVLGVVALDIGAHMLLLGAPLWLALGPLEGRRGRAQANTRL